VLRKGAQCFLLLVYLKSEKLGNFNFEKEGDDVYYLQNGIYRFNGKWKQRGFGKLKGKDIEHLETVERNDRLYYKLKVLRNTRIRSSILQNRIKDIGEIRPITRLVNVNADRKRFWLGALNSIEDKVCNDSMPLSLNHFTKNGV